MCLRRVVFALCSLCGRPQRGMNVICENCETYGLTKKNCSGIFRTVVAVMHYLSHHLRGTAAQHVFLYCCSTAPLLFLLFAPCCVSVWASTTNCWCERDVSWEKKKHSSPTNFGSDFLKRLFWFGIATP